MSTFTRDHCLAALFAALSFILPIHQTFGQQPSSSETTGPEYRDALPNPVIDPLWLTLRMLVTLDQQLPGFAMRQLTGAGLDEEKAASVVRYVQRAVAEHKAFERGMWQELCRDREEIRTEADLDPRMENMNVRSWEDLWDWIDGIPQATGLDSDDGARIVRALPTNLNRASGTADSATEDDRPARTEAEIAANLARVCGAYGF